MTAMCAAISICRRSSTTSVGNPWTAGLVSESEPWPWLWTPEIEAWQPYVPLGQRRGDRGEAYTLGSTGDSPVAVGDPPTEVPPAEIPLGW